MNILYKYNFIFTGVISCGTMRKLPSFHVMWLRGPRLPVACNVHLLWNYTHGSTCVESIRVEVATCIVEALLTHVELHTRAIIHVRIKLC